MFKIRFTIDLINLTPRPEMERARFELCEELPFAPSPHMDFHVLNIEKPVLAYTVRWDFERREFDVICRIHGLRYDSIGFDAMKDNLRESGIVVVDYYETTFTECGHSEWAPVGSGPFPGLCEHCVSSNKRRAILTEQAMATRAHERTKNWMSRT
jgi:hypothetical protein